MNRGDLIYPTIPPTRGLVEKGFASWNTGMSDAFGDSGWMEHRIGTPCIYICDERLGPPACHELFHVVLLNGKLRSIQPFGEENQ